VLVTLAVAIGVAIALMPEWLLPQFVLNGVASRRRGDIAFVGISLALSIVVGLLAVLLVK
jgi:hypothetical protein